LLSLQRRRWERRSDEELRKRQDGDMGMEEDLTYPSPDKQYPNAAKYSSYESIQTGAHGQGC
jgi:hypothetical protein